MANENETREVMEKRLEMMEKKFDEMSIFRTYGTIKAIIMWDIEFETCNV